MEILIIITNGLSVLSLIALLIILLMVTKEGNDERTHFMGYKLFSFLFFFLLAGISLIILITGWKTISYTLLRVSITTLFSLTIFAGLGFWLYLNKKT